MSEPARTVIGCSACIFYGRTGPDNGTDGCKIKTSDSLAAVLGLGFRVWILLDFVLSCAFQESGESMGTQKKKKEREDARASRGRSGQEVSREALHWSCYIQSQST